MCMRRTRRAARSSFLGLMLQFLRMDLQIADKDFDFYMDWALQGSYRLGHIILDTPAGS